MLIDMQRLGMLQPRSPLGQNSPYCVRLLPECFRRAAKGRWGKSAKGDMTGGTARAMFAA